MSAKPLGPWFWSDSVLWACVTTKENGGEVVATVHSPDPDEAREQARLLAAAPDLLAALEGLVRSYDVRVSEVVGASWNTEGEEAGPEWRRALEAISKARGR